MAGSVKVNAVQLGDSLTVTQNFELRTNVDGTATFERGDGQDILTVDVNGFIKMTDGPSIKTIKLSGTTAGGINLNSSVAHGITDVTKILSLHGRVHTSAGNIVPFNYGADATQLVALFADATYVYARTGPAAGATVFSRPFTILVTYEAP